MKHLTNIKALQAFHALRQIALILTNIFLAKSMLAQSDIGFFEMLLFIATTVSFFWTSGFIQGMLTTHPQLPTNDQKTFIFQVYVLFVGISALVFLILFFGKTPLCLALLGRASIPYYEWLSIYVFINIPTLLVENYLLLKKQALELVAYAIFFFVFYLLAVLVPVFIGWGLEWTFYALILFAVAKHLWLWRLLHQMGHFAWKASLLKPFVLVSLPLIAYALLGGLMQTFDNWLVAWFYNGDEEVFAIFRYGARELPISLALANSFSTAMLPEVAKNPNAVLSAIKNKSRKLFHLLFPIAIVGVLSSEYLFPLIFNPDFTDSAVVFNVYLLLTISRLLFPHTFLIGMGKTQLVLMTSIVEFLINVFLSFIFVHWWGLTGIALATVIAFSFEKVVYIVYLKRKYQIGWSRYTDLKWFGGYSIALILAFIWGS